MPIDQALDSDVGEFCRSLERQAVRLWVEDESLCFDGPQAAFSDLVMAALKRRKAEVIAHLQSRALSKPLRRVDDTHLPLSPMQQRLWFLDQLEGPSSVYNICGAYRLRGALSVSRLQDAFALVVARHEALRTVFAAESGVPRQVILPEVVVSIEERQLADQSNLIRELQSFYEREFTLDGGQANRPLVAAALWQCGQDDFVFAVSLHHAIADGWSCQILMQEVQQAYVGEVGQLPELALQYADYAIWQERWCESADYQRELGYWKQQLAGIPELLELPTTRPRPNAQSFSGDSLEFVIPEHLLREIAQLAQSHGASNFMVLAAGLSVLLARYSKSDDIVLGVPVANRPFQELEQCIGFFANTVLLRSSITAGACFGELLAQVKQSAISAFDHQSFPLERLVEELKPKRSLSYNPLFQVLFDYQTIRQNGVVQAGGLTLEPIAASRTRTMMDLSFALEEINAEIRGVVTFSTDLFDASFIAQLCQDYVALLQALCRQPQADVLAVDFLSAQLRNKLLYQWNQQLQLDVPAVCLHELIEAQVARTPEAIALKFGEQRLSYQELDQQANALAARLITAGVTPGMFVGVCMYRSLELVVSLLAVLKSGGVYVPLDPEYPAERLGFMVADAGAAVVLVHDASCAVLPYSEATLVFADREVAASEVKPDVALSPSSLAYMIYTSGSTGKPKGAMNTHAGVVNRLWWMQAEYQLDASDVVLQKTPFSFDVSVWEFFWPLIAGAKLVIATPGGHKDSGYLVRTICQESVTTLHFVPSMLQIFLATPQLEQCASLRRVICSGEALPKPLEQLFFQKLTCELHNLYGPTEAAIDVTYWQCRRDCPRTSVPIGKPIANIQTYILDDYLQPVPVGVIGELYLGGIGVGRGYHNRPELTAEKFLIDPFVGNSPSPLYRTGDLARFDDDGVIEYLGRCDSQVKLNGFRIELGEIEAVLLRQSQLKEAAVVVKDYNGAAQLVAYCVSVTAEPVDETELKAMLLRELPEFMVPKFFVWLAAMPLSANGKLARNVLPEVEFGSRPVREFVAPQSAMEVQVAAAWSAALHCSSVGRTDDFFELGGHSLLASLMVARLSQQLGVNVAVRLLFEYPVLENFAAQFELLVGSDDAEEEEVVL